jgi:hypothetical protein
MRKQTLGLMQHRALTVVGMDTGERKDKTCTNYDAVRGPAWDHSTSTVGRPHDNPVVALPYLRENIHGRILLVVENSVCNFSPNMRAQFLHVAKELDITLYPVSPKHTKNRRLDHGVEKDDRNDAWCLNQIGKEERADKNGLIYSPVVPYTALSEFKTLPTDPLVRARQVKYNLSDARLMELIPELPELVSAITSRPVPDCAVGCGAASETEKTKKRKWQPETAVLLAAAIAAIRCGSYRKMKELLFRHRGIYRSTYRNSALKPLCQCENADQRRKVFQAQVEFARFCLQISRGSASHMTRGSSASHTIRGPREKVSEASASPKTRGSSASRSTRSASGKQLSMFGGRECAGD